MNLNHKILGRAKATTVHNTEQERLFPVWKSLCACWFRPSNAMKCRLRTSRNFTF